MVRLQAVSEQFRIAKQGTLAETQKILVRVAKAEHAKVLAAEPQPHRFTRFVDGREGAAEEAVKPDGIILYEYPRIDMVAEFALEILREKSPVLTGAYRDGHTLFLNGAPIKVEGLAAWKPGDDVSIANYLSYSRKIEAGKMTMTVPGTDHVYQQAEQVVNSRFGNLAKTHFTYRAIVSGAYLSYQRAGTVHAAWSRRGGIERTNRFPALVISER